MFQSGGGLKSGTFYLVVGLLLAIVLNPAPAYSKRSAKGSLSKSSRMPAKAAIVVDDNDLVIYAKSPKLRLPPASTTKLVTAMVVLDNLDPEKMVKISRKAAFVHSIAPRLKPYEELTVKDLLQLALMRSTNSAAVALAEEVAGSERAFIKLMNRKAVEIGAMDTRFVNTSGLPKKGQYTTVYDLTLILKESLGYQLIKEILGNKEAIIVSKGGRRLFIRNTDRLLWTKENMIGGKTGYTRQARHCFVGAIETDRGPILIAILGASSRDRLWRTAQLLFRIASNRQVFSSAESIPLERQKNNKG